MVVFLNETRGTVIADKVKKADTYFKRLVGLLPRKGLEPGEGLWIIPCGDIHSIGMQFRFDAIFLNADLQVLYLIEAMKPMRISKFVKGAKTVLELDAGVIAQSQTELGDQLRVEEQA